MTVKNFVLMFPGQGSQSKGMGKELCEHFQAAREVFEEASDALGLDMKRLCFEDPESQLNLTEFTQPALVCVSVAAWRVLKQEAGLAPWMVAGHSLGEYSSLVCAGFFTLAQAVQAVRFRGQAMQKAVPVGTGAMVAYVGSQTQKVVELCGSISTPGATVEVANDNSPQQLVLSGHAEAVQRAQNAITEAKLGKVIPLPVSAPFHSTLMKPAADDMRRYLDKVTTEKNQLAVVANVDARIYGPGSYRSELLVQQICGGVKWTSSLRAIEAAAQEARLCWIEVGSGTVLQGLVKKTLAGTVPLGTQDFESMKAVLASVGE